MVRRFWLSVCTELRGDFLSRIRLTCGNIFQGLLFLCRERYISPGFTTFPLSGLAWLWLASPRRKTFPHPAILRPCTCPKVHIHSLSLVGGILGCCKQGGGPDEEINSKPRPARLVLSLLWLVGRLLAAV